MFTGKTIGPRIARAWNMNALPAHRFGCPVCGGCCGSQEDLDRHVGNKHARKYEPEEAKEG